MTIHRPGSEAMRLICAWCQRVRDPHHTNRWVPAVPASVTADGTRFTHGICPTCFQTVVRGIMTGQHSR